MGVITSIEDLRVLSKQRVPRMFHEYVDAGSWTESTYRANDRDLATLLLRQRVGVNVANRTLSSTMLGQPVTMPVALAPVGLTGLIHADGEILAAQAAERFGIPFTLSTMSICSIEDVAAACSKPFWFQLYVMKDRAFTARLIDRARAAGCSALMVTLDLPVMGQRNKDVKNGLSTIRPSLRNMLRFIDRPRWCLGMLGTQRRSFGNIIGHASGVDERTSLSAWTASQFDPSVTWDDINWIRQRWPGKLIVKGLMDAQDARLAVQCGVDAIVVSNHGGRQLDGTTSSIRALHDVVSEVKGEVEIHIDSGVRSGQDVIRALAMGASGVYIGRAFVYGLGALGQAGVTKCLEIIRQEMDLTMGFCGLRSVQQIERSILIEARKAY